jgi:cytochrome c553
MSPTTLRTCATLIGCVLVMPLLADSLIEHPSDAGSGAAGATSGETPAEIAEREYAEVLTLTPNIERGRAVYLTCAVCHLPEGWGSTDGMYPQIAGQLRTVVIKQLADFRAGNRDNPLMYPFSVPGILGGPQEIADVAAYVSALPMTADNGLGPGTDSALGETLYGEHCADCHGAAGEGDEAEHIPAIAGQHYAYLKRQFEAIRTGERKNADSKMTEEIQDLSAEQEVAVLDYTARLRPPADKLAGEGWRNPDFPHYVRDAMGLRAAPPAKLAPAVPTAPASMPRP